MHTQNSIHSLFTRTPLPERFCHFERLLEMLQVWNVDGVVLSTEKNIFYLTGFNPIAHKSDEPRPYAAVLSRHDPEHPILLVADYYLGHFLEQPIWVEDVRPVRAVMLPRDLPPKEDDLDRFLPVAGKSVSWMMQARGKYAQSIPSGCQDALKELGLVSGRVAFDDLRLGQRTGLQTMEVADGYDMMMQVRRIKTDEEISLLKTSTMLNQEAISQSVSSWQPGMTWRQLGMEYHRAATELGGFVNDPGGMVLAHPRGLDPSVSLQTGLEDFVIETGTHVMFDCHGSWNQYCWDGGKTWVVGDKASGSSVLAAKATSEAMRVIESAMRPGATIVDLQKTGRDVYRKMGVPLPESVLIFFHGLGLSHMDLEESSANGTPTVNWAMEKGMVVAVHLLWPGGEKERIWLEDVAFVGPDGAEPFFTWDLDPFSGS